MTYGTARAVRIITLAPIICFVLLTSEYASGNIKDIVQYFVVLLFLTVIPLLAYPLQSLFPRFRGAGRNGQRALAMIFAVAGYAGGCAAVIIGGMHGIPAVICFTYLISGLLLLLFNKAFRIRASGHACGVAGPVAVAVCTMGPWWYFGIALLVIVYWASLSLERHSLSELFAGSLIPVGAMVISFILCGVAL